MSNFETWWEREGQEFLFALNTTTDDDIKLVAEIAWKNGAYCAAPAARQALDALENAYENGFLTGITGLKTIDIITALREALAGDNMSPTEQPEQKPVGFWNGKETAWFEHELCGHPAPDGCTIPLYTRPVRTKDLTDEDFVQSEVKSLRQQVAALKAVLDAWNNVEQEPVAWPINGDIAKRIADKQCVSYEVVQLIAREIMASPVRTKDLTDDEKWAIFTSKDWTGEPLNLIDAVIAADRENNK